MNINKFNKRMLSKKEIDGLVEGINITRNFEPDTITKNSKHMGRWDAINDYLYKEVFNDENHILQIVKISEFWSFLAIYNTNNNVLFLLTKDNNLNKILKKGKDFYYIKVLSAINNKLEGLEEHFNDDNHDYRVQTIMPNIPLKYDILESNLEDRAKTMLLDIYDEIECCKIIGFKESNGSLLSLKEYILDYNLEVLNVVDLGQYIKPSMVDIEDTEPTINKVYDGAESNSEISGGIDIIFKEGTLEEGNGKKNNEDKDKK